MKTKIVRCLACVFVLACLALPASAENAATALYLPMPEGKAFDVRVSGWGQSEGESEQTDMDARLSSYHATGRFLLDPAQEGTPVFAVSWNELRINSSDPALPDDLVDVSVAGSVVRPLDEGWTLRVTAGGGFAGDNAFTDGSAFYGLANVTATHRLSEERGYMLIVDYNGNRSIFPDIPLPGFVYYDRLNENIRYSLGIPSGITWTPDSATTVRGVVTPGGVTGSAEYRLDDQLTLFALFDNHTRSFHLDSDVNDRRLFYKQSRVEGGVVWRGVQGDSFPGLEVRLAVGYAFDQEFSRGWDTRDDDTVRDITDEPYVRIGLGARF